MGKRKLSDILDRKLPSKEYIAKKHGLDMYTFQGLINAGARVEMEHTNRWDVAARIALAHLNERPDYYKLLKKYVEKKKKTKEELDHQKIVKEDIDVKSKPSLKDIITRPIAPKREWYKEDGVFDKFKEMDAQGKAHELPRIFKTSKENINAAFKHFKTKHGYEKLPSGLYHPANEAKLKELDSSGMSINDIATHFNTDKWVVLDHLKRLEAGGYKRTLRMRGGNGDRSKFWNDDRLAELNKHLSDKNKTPSQIQKAMGITKNQYTSAINSKNLKSKLSNLGVSRKIVGPKWMTPEHKEKLIAMDQSGKETLSSMGMKLGQPIHNIATALKHLEKHEGYKRLDRSRNHGSKGNSKTFNRFFIVK